MRFYLKVLLLFLMVCLVASYGYAGIIKDRGSCANGQCTLEVPVVAAVAQAVKKPLEVASAVVKVEQPTMKEVNIEQSAERKTPTALKKIATRLRHPLRR